MSVASCREKDVAECKNGKPRKSMRKLLVEGPLLDSGEVNGLYFVGSLEGLSLASLDPEIVIADGFELAVSGEAIKRDDVVLMRED